MARFLSDGRVDFPAMQQTLAALWKPGMGVYIKELETNLFLFQFYHEVDVSRVMEGCPWSFNRRALIMRRLKEGENPHNVELNIMELWVQVYDLKVGFMTERIIKEVGNNIGGFVVSCPSNFRSVWREYFRVRVAIDVTKPLKRRMKIKKADNDWYWINFKYENLPMFCFICGILGHSEKFCSKLFDTPEAEIVKPYGAWMRAPFKKQVKPIGAKWLHTENGDEDMPATTTEFQNGSGSNQDPSFPPQNQDAVGRGGILVSTEFSKNQSGGITGIRQIQNSVATISPTNARGEVTVVETKRRRINDDMGFETEMGLNTDVVLNTNDDLNMVEDQISPNNYMDSKNGPEAGTQGGARLAL